MSHVLAVRHAKDSPPKKGAETRYSAAEKNGMLHQLREGRGATVSEQLLVQPWDLLGPVPFGSALGSTEWNGGGGGGGGDVGGM